MLLIVNKDIIVKQNTSTSDTYLFESLKLLLSVATGVLREESQDNQHESNANENAKRTLKQLSLSISYSSSLHERCPNTDQKKSEFGHFLCSE